MNEFSVQIPLRFRQADPAGIAFFNEPLNIFHDVYEDWLVNSDILPETWFQHPLWAVPLKNVQCDYMAPLKAFETYTVKMSLSTIGTSSFTLLTEFYDNETLCCRLTTVHVFIDKKTFKAMDVPTELRKKLSGN